MKRHKKINRRRISAKGDIQRPAKTFEVFTMCHNLDVSLAQADVTDTERQLAQLWRRLDVLTDASFRTKREGGDVRKRSVISALLTKLDAMTADLEASKRHLEEVKAR